MAKPRIHSTALVEDGVTVGDDTAIWDSVHVRSGAEIGSGCIVGEKTYIAGGVRIGNLVKINAFVYLCTGVTLEPGVMVSAGVTFTNDRFPRGTDADVTTLRSSAPGPETEFTVVREGATLGARAVIGPGLTVGRWAMVGMGSVVTRDVDDHTLVVGNPARPAALLCRCGEPFLRLSEGTERSGEASCSSCADRYSYQLRQGNDPTRVDRLTR